MKDWNYVKEDATPDMIIESSEETKYDSENPRETEQVDSGQEWPEDYY